MPVFKSGKGLAPKWGEMEFFEIIELPAGKSHKFDRISGKEKLIVGKGKCKIAFGKQSVQANAGTNLELTNQEEYFEVLDTDEEATLIRMCGNWGNETGGSGLFAVQKTDDPQNVGDPSEHPRNASFDNHFHDCDEYWIIYEGQGIAVSEGKPYEVGLGDCVATGMGHHHDFPQVFEPIKAVFFETTLAGQKRHGHLWNHQHGIAEPQKDRI
jgi:mannose-6-phosphate isomerase-like protein (cupin superfamily)